MKPAFRQLDHIVNMVKYYALHKIINIPCCHFYVFIDRLRRPNAATVLTRDAEDDFVT